MKKQCVIVGLGKFGKSIAKKLSDSKIEVLALDSDIKTIEKISPYVTKAVCMDVTSEESWNQLPIKISAPYINKFARPYVLPKIPTVFQLNFHTILQNTFCTL